MFSPRRLALISALLIYEGTAAAQTLFMGAAGPYGGNVDPPSTQTTLQLSAAASLDGEVTKATFGWSGSPCPGAVKIKFFRPGTFPIINTSYALVAERGPFDVNEPARSPFERPTVPPVTQTVSLIPPVALLARDGWEHSRG